jgi:transcriptional regulator with XRE-family HTH domain
MSMKEVTVAEADSKRIAMSERLRTARELAGLSQGQVAKELGLHRPSVSEMEAGRRRVSAEELARMADLYAVDLAWLAGGEAVSDGNQARVELAARELSKLREEDLDRVLKVLSALRKD